VQRKIVWPWFVVGCVLLLAALAAFFWAFALGNLTQSQHFLLMWLLPLASGFACGCFAGSLKATGPMGNLALAATGGFAVWVLSYFLLPKPIPPTVEVGNDSVVMGQVKGKVGDGSVVVGPTDTNGNTVITQSMAVGHNAQAGPGSIAIGAGAKAGVQTATTTGNSSPAIVQSATTTASNSPITQFAAGTANLTIVPNVISAAPLNPADAVPGTEFTHSALRDLFPYGYGLVYCDDEPPLRYEVFKEGNKKLDWDVDWKNIVIERDVAAMTVRFHVPARAEGTNIIIAGPDKYSEIVFPSRLKTGTLARGGFQFRNVPVLYALTLNGNQRKPVFAIGYRITTDDEPGARLPKRPLQP
jgi:hypothetical protein